MKANKITNLSTEIKNDLEIVNEHLLYILDILTPVDEQITEIEKIILQNIITALNKLPINNYSAIQKYL